MSDNDKHKHIGKDEDNDSIESNDWIVYTDSNSNPYAYKENETIPRENTNRIDKGRNIEREFFEQNRYDYGYSEEYRSYHSIGNNNNNGNYDGYYGYNNVHYDDNDYNNNYNNYYINTNTNTNTNTNDNNTNTNSNTTISINTPSNYEGYYKNNYHNNNIIIIDKSNTMSIAEEQITPAYINKLFNATSSIPLNNVNKLISNQTIESVEESYYTGGNGLENSIHLGDLGEDIKYIPVEDLSKSDDGDDDKKK